MDLHHYLREVSVIRDKIENHDQFPFTLPVIRHLGKLEFSPSVTFLSGENGSGKSTIIEAIAVALGFNVFAHIDGLPGATIYQINDGALERVDYKNTEHYDITRTFLDNPARMIEVLFDEMESRGSESDTSV